MTTTAPVATATASTASELGTLLAQHPVGWWLAGVLTLALLGAAALAGLRTLRHHAGPPLNRFFPAQAPTLMLAAMAASACVLVLAGATMAELAESGRTQGPWGVLDDTIAAGLQAQADTTVLQVFTTLTHLGDTWVLTALTLGVAAALWLCQHRLLAMGWLVAMAGNGALTKVLKNLFERVRPEHTHGIAEASGYSFPSGHSSASMVAYAMLAYLATRLLPRVWHLPAAMVAGVLIFTTGWSRVVLQVHYASDVLAGWLLGGTWMVCTVLIMESVSRWRSPALAAAAAQRT
jgi:undecaprenyl-diphosphatase